LRIGLLTTKTRRKVWEAFLSFGVDSAEYLGKGRRVPAQ